MARFYFDTKIGNGVYEDPEGEEYDNAETAIASGRMDAAQYVADLIARGTHPDSEERLIRDETGVVVDRFMLADALGCIGPKRRQP